MLKENDKAPDFSLMGSDGKTHSLGDFKGKYLVLYFYPRDDTPGCTTEAKCFNGGKMMIRSLGGEIVGVSADSLESHDKFISKYGLGFLLLSDPDKKMINKYEAYGDKGIFGMGIIRKTYIIGKDGRILKIFPRVKAQDHDKQVVEFLKTQKN